MRRSAHEDLPDSFSLSRAGYYLDFALAPLCGGCLLIWAVVRSDGSAQLITLWFFVGWLAWTLVEYLVHRFVFHGPGPIGPMHAVHHRHPVDYVGIATWGTAVGFVTWWGVAFAFAGGAVAASLTSGALWGYLMYVVVHDRMHHGDRQTICPYMRFMRDRHDAHHRGGRAWYGVSSPIWDVLLGTTKQL